MKLDKYVLVLVASLALLLAGCGGGSSTTTTPPPPDPGPTAGEMAIMNAKQALSTAQAAVGSATTDQGRLAAQQGVVQAASNLIDVLTANGGSAADIRAASNALGDARSEIGRLEEAIAAAAKDIAAVIPKLFAGITSRASLTGFTPTGYSTDGSQINVAFNDVVNTISLSEDEDVAVAALHGWEGKMFKADDDTQGTYEAVVYSNVGEPTQGKKFGSAAAVTPDGNFQYQLTDGATAVDTTQTGVPARVALTGVTRTAGTETFNLPDPNPGGATVINVPGSYHGVSGTYRCTPSTPADGCSASVAASGFTLAGGAWTFAPTDPNARVTDTPDSAYASYGWWLRKSVDGNTFNASAFAIRRGAAAPASDIDDLNGKATYRGGAVGKYALSSSTGGTNDAGHFTARATLEANFTGNDTATAITGTIDNFMGADGESRDWSVKLNGSQISDTGLIGNASASTGVDTVWTIDGRAADASGDWTGSLQENGTDGVPEVATGTFYTEYGKVGKMVGAFGANEE